MPVAAEEDTEERAEDEKDFDEDGNGDGGDSVVVEMSQLVVRVRRDSGDSLGSEISHSPPSSPISRDQGRFGGWADSGSKRITITIPWQFVAIFEGIGTGIRKT